MKERYLENGNRRTSGYDSPAKLTEGKSMHSVPKNQVTLKFHLEDGFTKWDAHTVEAEIYDPFAFTTTIRIEIETPTMTADEMHHAMQPFYGNMVEVICNIGESGDLISKPSMIKLASPD